MKGDFTRFTHDPTKHYNGVLKQQGRVDLDADWNEQVAIQQYLDRTRAVDVIGPCGAPRDRSGFKVSVDSNGHLRLTSGHLYVDGILCELLSDDVTYQKQEDYPSRPDLIPKDGRIDLVYLDVWERHITAIEDPDIREEALGGPDTATRVKTVWQVKVMEDVENACVKTIENWPPQASGGRLSIINVSPAETPCTISPASGYQGPENRLYRVEIHKGGIMGEAIFKWSRDNGSVAFAIDEFIEGQSKKVKVQSLGRDRLALRKGDWVEVLDDEVELAGDPSGTMAQITEIDEAGRILTLSAAVVTYKRNKHPKVRRWDQGDKGIAVTSQGISLDGIKIMFSTIAQDAEFKTGDYWVFAARSATGEVDSLTEAKPLGVTHHYCPLALVYWRSDKSNWEPSQITDLRFEFQPLIGQTDLYYVSGDGQEAIPGQELPQPLQVRVANGGQPIAYAKVRFSIDTKLNPDGLLAGTPGGTSLGAIITSRDDITGPDGIASCYWKLDPDPGLASQQVAAVLLDACGEEILDADGHPVHHAINFNGRHSLASLVGYTPCKDCKLLDGAVTVQEALEELCKLITTGNQDKAVRITEVYLQTPEDLLENDSDVEAEDLAKGIHIECNEEIDPASVLGKPVCHVTLYLPVTLPGHERVIGHQPVVLTAEVTVTKDNKVIYWCPGENWRGLLPEDPKGKIQARLILEGNFVWYKKDSKVYLDGESFGKPAADNHTRVVLPSGDNRRGGDFEMWFWVTNPGSKG